MPAPLDQFTVAGATLADPHGLKATAAANMAMHAGQGKALAESFLSAQAELLIANGCNTLNLKSVGDAGVGKKSAGCFDPGPPISMNLTADNGVVDIARTASHEMTHGIESIVQNHDTEQKVTIMLEEDKAHAKETFVALASVLPFGPSQIRENFKPQIAKAGGVKAFDKIAEEIGAYINESIFYEINETGRAANFIKRFDKIYAKEVQSAGGKRKQSSEELRDRVQEIVAVSISDINTHIISHLEARQGPNDGALAAELRAVNDHLFPAYQRAEAKYNGQFTAAALPPLNSAHVRHRKVARPDVAGPSDQAQDATELAEDLQKALTRSSSYREAVGTVPKTPPPKAPLDTKTPPKGSITQISSV